MNNTQTSLIIFSLIFAIPFFSLIGFNAIEHHNLIKQFKIDCEKNNGFMYAPKGKGFREPLCLDKKMIIKKPSTAFQLPVHGT